MKDLSRHAVSPPTIATKEYVDAQVIAGGGERFVHVQSSPSTVWTVVHNLGFMPQVAVIIDDEDSTDGVLIVHQDENQFTVTSVMPIAGKAVAD